jgi:hypothetical protein
VHATMPLVLWTTLLRLGNETNSGSEAGKIALKFNGMAPQTLSLTNCRETLKMSCEVGEVAAEQRVDLSSKLEGV